MNNLKQFGLAHHNYLSAMGVFVPGGLADLTQGGSFNFYASPCAMLIPYFEGGAVASQYNYSQIWYKQPQAVANAVINTFVCPSDDKDNPIYSQGSTTGGRFPRPTPSHPLILDLPGRWRNQAA